MTSLMSRLLQLACCASVAGLMSACEMVVQFKPTELPIEKSMNEGQPKPEASRDPEKVVCDPFGTNKTASKELGLLGKLYTLKDEDPRYSRIEDYLQFGTPHDLDLYFSQLNVPTRAFDQGFINQEGKALTNSRGDTLFEWFALHFESSLKLPGTNKSGKYQFAIASDDGSIMKVGSPGDATALRTLIDNDGVKATTIRCATETVQLNSTSKLPITIDYFQGPRYHIALILLYREIPDAVDEIAHPEALQDASCGGGDWPSMLSRGWKVVEPELFHLSGKTTSNPCANQGQ